MPKCEGHSGVVVKETLMSSPCHEVVRASLVVTLVKIHIIVDVRHWVQENLGREAGRVGLSIGGEDRFDLGNTNAIAST